ncbi:YegP family protein [Streptosporangium sp. NPDC000396]|uniref:YegP family protein n=1 Tax=Streptosporangium sp. NPDC000396 TaxID=3366185 RepID=UPI0036CE7C27
MAGKFVITRDTRGEFRFKLVAGNGQTIAVSEAYSTKVACMNGIESVRKHAADAVVDDSALISTGAS